MRWVKHLRGSDAKQRRERFVLYGFWREQTGPNSLLRSNQLKNCAHAKLACRADFADPHGGRVAVSVPYIHTHVCFNQACRLHQSRVRLAVREAGKGRTVLCFDAGLATERWKRSCRMDALKAVESQGRLGSPGIFLSLCNERSSCA